MTSGPPPISGDIAKRIRLVVLDVDGVLTDGAVYIGATEAGAPVELKRFDVTDGLGIMFLVRSGIDVVFISARSSPATRVRAEELGVREVFQDPAGRKVPILKEMLDKKGLTWEQVAFVGDDIADLGALQRVGLPATTANGLPDICRVVSWKSQRAGGHGAVREFAEALLQAREEWEDLVDEYCRARSV